MFLLESPHRGDSNEYIQYTIFNIERKISPKLSQICSFGISQGLKNEFNIAVVNEPSVLEPLKFYCTSTYLADAPSGTRNFITTFCPF